MVLFWVNNHFNDFETDPAMCEFLEHFECLLEQEVGFDLILMPFFLFTAWIWDWLLVGGQNSTFFKSFSVAVDN